MDCVALDIGLPICDEFDCVECVVDADCTNGQICDGNECLAPGG
jgi:Cys-rich repeat protein